MTDPGRVKYGVVALSRRRVLPEGTIADVRTINCAPNGRARRRPQSRTLFDQLRRFAGKARGLPPDASKKCACPPADLRT